MAAHRNGHAPGHRFRPASREERQIAIAELVLEAGSIGIQEIAARFGISRMTVYRDVSDLESAGVVVLDRGAVVAGSSSFTETSHTFRATLHSYEKAMLCEAARSMIRPGSTIMLDDSSTLLPLVPMLADLAPLTVITHSLAIASLVSTHRDLRLFLAGGTYRATYESFAGESTLRALEDVSADVALMSSTAIHDGVLFHPLEENVAIKRIMLARAERRILLADSSKFGVRATHRVGTVSDFDSVVVAGEIPAAELRALDECDVTTVDV